MADRTITGVIVVGAIGVVAAATWYFASPYWAVRELRDATATGDRTALSERVDFPAVRDSLKSQLHAGMAAEVTRRTGSGPLGVLGAMIGSVIGDRVVDIAITPDMIRQIVLSGKMVALPGVNAGVNAGAGADTPDASDQAQWTIDHDGLDHFRARADGANGAGAVTLVFRRDGLSWVLSDIIADEGSAAASFKGPGQTT